MTALGDPDTISPEQSGLLVEAGLIISPSSVRTRSRQAPLSLFRNLPTVTDRGYTLLPAPETQASYIKSTLSHRWIISRLADAIIEAAEGRGRKRSS